MLEQFMAAKQPEIRALQALAARNALPGPWPGVRPPFAAALKASGPMAVIAEYKRASPSRGVINQQSGAAEAGRLFKRAGAAAISVLTIKDYFDGELAYLTQIAPAGLPLLRKDFITHPLQVYQTAATPASALLLIVRLFKNGPGELEFLLKLSRQQQLETVVEVFDETDLDTAQQCGSPVIQVNNRNLDTLEMDYRTTRRLIVHKQPHETWIAASGITQRQQIDDLAAAGYDAVLIGSAIMAHSHPQAYLQSLTCENGSQDAD